MRLALFVNNRKVVRASLQAKGYLSAHLTLSDGLAPDEETNSVRLVAYDKSEEPNSVTSFWAGSALSVGDKVEIDILPDGESDPPTEVTRSSESPRNLFSTIEQARLLLSAVKVCDTALMGVLDRAQESEPPDELEKIRRAVGEIIVELDRQLISPTLRSHPSLLGETKEAGLI
jgi:hypothetical protein